MALPDISIFKRNGGLGRQKPTADGITGLVTQGPAVPGKLDLGKVYELRSLAAAEALGIVASAPAYAKVHHQISEFYRLAPGAILLLMVVAYDVSMAEMADRAQPYAKKMLVAQNGRIKQLGFYLNSPAAYVPAYAGGLDADVLATVAKAQALADEEFKQHRPLWCAVAGHGLADDLSTAADLTTKLAPLVSVVVATDYLLQPDEPALGALLGMVAAVPVHICIGYVGGCQLAGDGSFLQAGLSNGTANEDLLPGDLGGLHDKGYIVAVQHPGADGLFFSDSPTCVGKDSDYCQIENVRTVNKAAALIRQALLPQLKGPLLLNGDGTLQPQVLGDLEERGAQALTTGMQRAGQQEISAKDVYIDPETVLSSGSEKNPLQVAFSVVPVGVSRIIEATIGLVTNL